MKLLKLRVALNFIILIINPIFGQKFEWARDGYNICPYGGQFVNVDNTGLNISVSTFSECEELYDSIQTGINDFGHRGVWGIIHTYRFDFNRYVDVSFTITDINVQPDPSGLSWYDLLYFTNNPRLQAIKNVIVSNDSVYPTDYSIGTLKVSYQNVNTFTIYHGGGVKVNPGYIFISPLNYTLKSDVGLEDQYDPDNFNVSFDPVIQKISINCPIQIDGRVNLYSM